MWRKENEITMTIFSEAAKEALQALADREKKQISEGIEFDTYTKEVSYYPFEEKNVDTSIEHNPTVDRELIDGIDVWSLFKRVLGDKGDGNPLVYALKGEDGWHFASEKDRQMIFRQIDVIAAKFCEKYDGDITVVLPSGNKLNTTIAKYIKKHSPNMQILTGIIMKRTAEDIWHEAASEDSEFRKILYQSINKKNSNIPVKFQREMNDEAMRGYFDILEKAVARMIRERGGYFTYHFIKDPNVRNAITQTMKLNDRLFYDASMKINGHNVLLIDDTISRGQTIKQAAKLVKDNFTPKTVTVLTLLSKLYIEEE